MAARNRPSGRFSSAPACRLQHYYYLVSLIGLFLLSDKFQGEYSFNQRVSIFSYSPITPRVLGNWILIGTVAVADVTVMAAVVDVTVMAAVADVADVVPCVWSPWPRRTTMPTPAIPRAGSSATLTDAEARSKLPAAVQLSSTEDHSSPNDGREGPSRSEPEAMAMERCYNAMLKARWRWGDVTMRCSKRDGDGATLRCDAQSVMAMGRCYDAMLKGRWRWGDVTMRCSKRDGDGAMLRCDAQSAMAMERCYDAMLKARWRWGDVTMRCSKRDGDGAMLRCDAQRAMAMERCYDAMLKAR